jgi:Na+/proline symporter
MRPLDLIVLIGTLGFIIIYGVLKTRGKTDMHGYLRSGGEKKWWAICLSVMATHASAITFISTPGQAYESGMGFLQIYFGLPLAMIVISAVFIPLFYKQNVYTAYEYLEGRFGLATRQFIAFLFLLSRSLATGITIYAPAIILSTLLGLNMSLLCVLIGLAVIVYIYAGGEKAVSKTHVLQMTVILGGMGMALVMLIHYLPKGVSVIDATKLAGKMSKMSIVDTGFNLNARYNLWSGILGGFFLSLSYFGTDQSQVSRYLGGTSAGESKMGLFYNGMVKIPMQFFILFIGVMTYIFFMFNHSPVFFNSKSLQNAKMSMEVRNMITQKENEHAVIESERSKAAMNILKNNYMNASGELTQLKALDKKDSIIRSDVKTIISANAPGVETKDTDYVFLTFVLNYLPAGLVGLLLAVMFCAAMSSTSGQIASLASTTVIDFYKRSFSKGASDTHYVKATKITTLLWGGVVIGFAISIPLFENLIQAVNILGSLFYGTILGVFLLAFFFRWLKGTEVLIAALISEFSILILYFTDKKISFLWLNPIGVALVIVIANFIYGVSRLRGKKPNTMS